MLRSFLLLISLFLSGTIIMAQQTTVESMEYDGKTRSYRVHVPGGFDGSQSLPLVFNLHGFGSNAFEQEVYSGMDAVADNNNFIVCYAEGVDASWNVGWEFGSTEDDVGFISALIDRLKETHNIDLNRVYSCGMSNGGFMSLKLACDLSERIAAVASVTGSMVDSELPLCDPSRPFPVMQIHGTDDPVVAYDGTPGVSIAIEDLIDYWVNKNNCETDPDSVFYEDIVAEDLSTAIGVEYRNCSGDSEVNFIKIIGGGHTWPGATINIGPTNLDINGSQVIWDFFNKYSLDITSSNTSLESQPFVFSLSPNPASEIVNLQGLNPGNFVRVISSTGKIISESQTASSNMELDVSKLLPGLYFIMAGDDQQQQIEKFIKQ